MAIYYPAGCEVEVPDHICETCTEAESGRIRSAGFIKTSFNFADPSNPVEWRAGINNRSIVLIDGVIGSFDGGTEVEGPGYGSQATKLLGYDFTANFRDPNYKQNAAYYNALKNSKAYKFFYVTESLVHITNNAVGVIPKNPVAEDLTSDVVWDVTVKWSDKDLPEPYDKPDKIFECFTVAP